MQAIEGSNSGERVLVVAQRQVRRSRRCLRKPYILRSLFQATGCWIVTARLEVLNTPSDCEHARVRLYPGECWERRQGPEDTQHHYGADQLGIMEGGYFGVSYLTG